jgi:probable rRNA maturation factor
MNRVIIRAREIEKPFRASVAAAFCKKVLRKLSLDNCELSVVFCNNEFMQALNEKFRRKNEPTDILSFSQTEGGVFPGERTCVIGDMVISLDMVKQNCREFSVPEEEELKRLLIHGILHLLGLNHGSVNPDEPMLIRQEEILHELSEERLF